MRAYQQERIDNAICYFAAAHHKGTRRYVSQTELYKYLAFFDFRVLEETGQAPLDLDYIAMDHGPVPGNLYASRRERKSPLYRFEEQSGGVFLIKPTGQPDLDLFSDYEREEMEALVYMFATSGAKARTMSQASHESIRAWRVAYDRAPNSRIDKADTFPGLEGKAEDKLTAAEERFLLSRALQKIGA